MNEPTKTPGSDAARAEQILNRLDGDRISSESTPVVLADLLEAQTRALLAINETLNVIAGLLETGTLHVADAARL